MGHSNRSTKKIYEERLVSCYGYKVLIKPRSADIRSKNGRIADAEYMTVLILDI